MHNAISAVVPVRTNYLVCCIALCLMLVGCSDAPSETTVSRCFDSTITPLTDGYSALSSIESEGSIYIWAAASPSLLESDVAPSYRLYRFTATADQGTLEMLTDVDGIEGGAGLLERANLLLVDNGALYFSAYSSEFGFELWMYPLDGSDVPRVLFDLTPGSYSSNINWFVRADEQFFMAAGDYFGSTEIYRWSGNVNESPVTLKALGVEGEYDYTNMAIATQDNLFFAATAPGVGHEWWRYPIDNSSNPVLVADIKPGAPDGLKDYDSVAFLYQDKIYFSASDENYSEWLWSMDATNNPNPKPVTLSNASVNGLREPRQYIGTAEGLYFVSSVGNLMLLVPGQEPVKQGYLHSVQYLVKVGSSFFYNSYTGPSFVIPGTTRRSLEAFSPGDTRETVVIEYADAANYTVTGLYKLNERLFSVEEAGIRSVLPKDQCG